MLCPPTPVLRSLSDPLASATASHALRSYTLLISVRDSGIGVSRDALQRLFSSFSQAHPETNRLYGGTGLGLAISKSLVNLLGGTIWMESVLGQGSTVFIKLPVKGLDLETAAAGLVSSQTLSADKKAEAKVLQQQRALDMTAADVADAATHKENLITPFHLLHAAERHSTGVQTTPTASQRMVGHDATSSATPVVGVATAAGSSTVSSNTLSSHPVRCAVIHSTPVVGHIITQTILDWGDAAQFFTSLRGLLHLQSEAATDCSKGETAAEAVPTSGAILDTPPSHLSDSDSSRIPSPIAALPPLSPSSLPLPSFTVGIDPTSCPSLPTSAPADFDVILVDLMSCRSLNELPLLLHLYALTRQPSCGAVLLGLVPLGTSHSSVEGMVDSVASHPLKARHLYLAVHEQRRPQGLRRALSRPTSSATEVEPPAPVITSAEPASSSNSSASVSIAPPPDPLVRSKSKEKDASSMESAAAARASASLPASSHHASPSSSSSLSFAASHPLRILIAEDNSINIRILSKMLQRLGYSSSQYRLTADGRSAAEELHRENMLIPAPISTNNQVSEAANQSPGSSASASVVPPLVKGPDCYDLILMDLQMPLLDGCGSSALIRGYGPSVHQPYICAITANAMEGDANTCMNAGMNDYLTKPVTMEALSKALSIAYLHSTKNNTNPAANGAAGNTSTGQ